MNNKLPKDRIVGAKQTIKALKSGITSTVYVAKNADANVIAPIVSFCDENNINAIIYQPFRKFFYNALHTAPT